LPEGAVVAGLPAFDRLGRGFEAGVGGQIVLDGPAANAGAVGGEVEAAVEFAGGGAVGGGWFGGEQFGEQGDHRVRPVWTVITAGKSGGPSLEAVLGTSFEIVAVDFVKAGVGQIQFVGSLGCGKFSLPMRGQKMTDERHGQTFDQLQFFIMGRITEGNGFIALELMPAGACRAAMRRPGRPFIRLESALGLRPRRALSSAQARAWSRTSCAASNPNPSGHHIIPLLIAQGFPVLIAPRQSKKQRGHFPFLGSSLCLTPDLNLNLIPFRRIRSKIKIKKETPKDTFSRGGLTR